jgi:carbonic anhydrase
MVDKYLQRSESERKRYLEDSEDSLARLTNEGQSPEALFITCSDARIMPEQLLNAKPGQFFIFRNIANLIPPYWHIDLAVSSVLEYAVCDLSVADIIICGHTDCAGIRAFERPLDLSSRPGFTRWLEFARPAFLTREVQGLKAGSNEYHRAVIERNVVNQIKNLRSYPFIASRIESGEIQLHGWVYYLDERAIRYYDVVNDTFRRS